MNTSRGIRNQNPGNIRISGAPWAGKVSPNTDGSFEQFDTPENGIRALAKTLLAYFRNHNLHTIRAIISRWAPSSENNTEGYIQFIAGSLGIAPAETIDLTHADMLAALCEAIIQRENGVNPYSMLQVDRGVRMALGVAVPSNPNIEPAT